MNAKRRIDRYKESNPNELSEEQFRKLEHEIEYPKEEGISDEYFDFKLWCIDRPSRQEYFANFLSKKLLKHQGAKILEVGGGRTGRLSRMLAKKGFDMTCIDPKLEFEGNEIKCIREKFDYKKFDLTSYDYVIAQEPCEATEHIVRACIAQDIPFFIILCGTSHRLISGKKPKTAREWYEYLENIDNKKIKFRYISIYPVSRIPIIKSNKF